MKETWECTICRATATIDTSGPRVQYHSIYPADTGPYGGKQKIHDCPIRQGLIPPQILESPNARRKA